MCIASSIGDLYANFDGIDSILKNLADLMHCPQPKPGFMHILYDLSLAAGQSEHFGACVGFLTNQQALQAIGPTIAEFSNLCDVTDVPPNDCLANVPKAYALLPEIQIAVAPVEAFKAKIDATFKQLVQQCFTFFQRGSDR